MEPRDSFPQGESSGGWPLSTVVWEQVTVCTPAITGTVTPVDAFHKQNSQAPGKASMIYTGKNLCKWKKCGMALTNIDVPFSRGWARVSTWGFMLSRTTGVFRLMQQQHTHIEKPYERKEWGKVSCVCSAFVPSNISHSKDSHTLSAKYVGTPFVTTFFTHYVRILTREDPRVQWMWKGLHSPLFVWSNRIHAGEKPFEYKNIREPFVIAPPWFHMGRLTWGRNTVNPVNVDSPSAFIYSLLSLRVFTLGRNPVSVRNGPKPFTLWTCLRHYQRTHTGKTPFECNSWGKSSERGSVILWGIIPKRNNCSYAVRKSEISHHLLSLEESYRKWNVPIVGRCIWEFIKEREPVATVQFQKSSTIALPFLCPEKATTGMFKKHKQRRKENISRY